MLSTRQAHVCLGLVARWLASSPEFESDVAAQGVGVRSYVRSLGTAVLLSETLDPLASASLRMMPGRRCETACFCVRPRRRMQHLELKSQHQTQDNSLGDFA